MASKPPIVPSPPDRPDELVAVGRPATLSGGELEESLLERIDPAGEDARRLGLIEVRLVEVELTGAALDHATLTPSACGVSGCRGPTS